ncbi:polyprenyl synthetase family protein [Fructilactobacillus sp. Tb1]|uniref:polyprenyl synthetase family protein n=1 Tax=Fructilactobacillus sp. Tb1 TaxID=3422304 RepID=UPI003D2A917D
MDYSLWKQFPTLETKLKNTQKIMIDQINIDNRKFKKGIDNLINGNGKMIRAALLLLFSEYGNNNDELTFEKAAASIEIIHLASLVHDDVIDESDLRRTAETLNKRFGQREAIYLGDYLFTQYFKLLIDYAPNKSNLTFSIDHMQAILDGELHQSLSKNDVKRSVADYFKAINGKTSALFVNSAAEGAVLGGADGETIKLAEQIGSKLGDAFQIRDDLLDFNPTYETGKPELEDVTEGIYTLPIIYALQTNYKKELTKLLKKDQLDLADLSKIQNIIEISGGLAKAKQTLTDTLNECLVLIDSLPTSDAKPVLKTIVAKLFK